MIVEFMGKRLIFNHLHIQDLMHDSNNINNAIGFKASIALISLIMSQGQNMWIVGMTIKQELKIVADLCMTFQVLKPRYLFHIHNLSHRL
jgi:hypothetical protein